MSGFVSPAEEAAGGTGPVGEARKSSRQWLRLFAAGLLLWVLTVVVTFLTGNVNLVPTIILLGSFLVPVTFVAWAAGRAHVQGIDLWPGSRGRSWSAASWACSARRRSRRTCCRRLRSYTSVSG